MKHKSCQWILAIMSQNFIEIYCLGAELHRFPCDLRTDFLGKRLKIRPVFQI